MSIDLDRFAEPGATGAGRASARRATPLVRIAALLALAIAAGAPPGLPPKVTAARTVPLPSYCTGVPIPGGRLNLLHDGGYIILDAPTDTIISEGRCPHRRAGR